jgi:hypothetical protein
VQPHASALPDQVPTCRDCATPRYCAAEGCIVAAPRQRTEADLPGLPILVRTTGEARRQAEPAARRRPVLNLFAAHLVAFVMREAALDLRLAEDRADYDAGPQP